MFLLVIAALLSLLAGYIAWYYLVYVPRYPPGPRPLPLLGNLPHLPSTGVDEYFAGLSRLYGPVYTLYLPKPNVIVTSYDTIREALIDKSDHFLTKAAWSPIFRILAAIPNGGIIVANGDMWREQRKMALHILRDFGMGKSLMEQRIMGSVGELVENLDRHVAASDGSGVVEVDMFYPVQVG